MCAEILHLVYGSSWKHRGILHDIDYSDETEAQIMLCSLIPYGLGALAWRLDRRSRYAASNSSSVARESQSMLFSKLLIESRQKIHPKD